MYQNDLLFLNHFLCCKHHHKKSNNFYEKLMELIHYIE